MDLVWGAIGGLVIGSAAAFYLSINGRIMGASGILGGLVDRSARGTESVERGAFLLGLIAAPAIVIQGLQLEAGTNITRNVFLIILAGLLVGSGTRIGNGCTSGHGVCGISRLSVRGIVATVVYIAAGALTVLLVRMISGVD